MADEKNPHGLTVGQQLWFVPWEGRKNARFVTITKMGREWAEADGLQGPNRRVNIKTLDVQVKGYGSVGTLHLSREAYEAEVSRCRLFNTLKSRMRDFWNTPPASVTEGDIRAAAKLLGFDLEAES